MTDDTESWYLERLAEAAAALPPESREDLLDEIRTHIAEARAAGQVHDEASLRQLLDRLGEPEEIVAAASADETQPVAAPAAFAPQPPMSYRQPGIGLEITAFILITVGSIVPIIGWLVGVILLWPSRRLTASEKLLATLVVPGGAASGHLPRWCGRFRRHRAIHRVTGYLAHRAGSRGHRVAASSPSPRRRRAAAPHLRGGPGNWPLGWARDRQRPVADGRRIRRANHRTDRRADPRLELSALV
jgi:uncharacterized membrane protein